jgi:hypothetical protein
MKFFLSFVFALFVGVLIFVYIETKAANPILLDEKSHPIAQSHE